MIKVYFLEVEIINGATHVAGETVIHHALLEATELPDIRKLIMDTTPDEDNFLAALAIEARDATQQEIDLYNAQVIIIPENPDIIRATELLANSPDIITQPEMWELMRIFGRLLSIPN